MFTTFWDFFCVWPNFPDYWFYVIIENKRGMYELPHEFPNDLRLESLRKSKLSGKFQNFIELFPNPQYSQNENFVSTSKNLLRNRNWSLLGVRCFTWKLAFASNILRMIVGRLTEKLPNNSTNNFMLTRILNRLNLIPISIYGKAITSTQRFINDRDNFSLIKNQQPSFYFRRFL